MICKPFVMKRDGPGDGAGNILRSMPRSRRNEVDIMVYVGLVLAFVAGIIFGWFILALMAANEEEEERERRK